MVATSSVSAWTSAEPVVPPTPPDISASPQTEPVSQDLPTGANVENSGESGIVVTARKHDPADPIESVNVVSFRTVQVMNDVFVGPVVHTYQRIVPRPARRGLHNLLNNLDEPIVFVNFLLQLKPKRALQTAGRFAINSTVGLGGLFDVARHRPFSLPRRSNGLADTLGYYGVKPGPYLFLPLIGSTTVRDLLGRSVDLLLLPVGVGAPFNRPVYSMPHRVLNAVDEQSENDAELTRSRTSNDPYAAIRDHYLQRRSAEIDVLRGHRTSVNDPSPMENAK